MSLPQILALSLVEIVGDFGFKQYANHGGAVSFVIGTVGYIGVIIMLIISLQGSTVLMVNSAWDGISGLIESICAIIFLGERFHNYLQYLGIILVAVGLSLLKIPMHKSHPFHIPHM